MTSTETTSPTVQGAQFATIWQRIFAYVIDGIILGISMVVVFLAIDDAVVEATVALVVAVLYEVLLTSYLGGTLGKLIFGIRVSTSPDQGINVDPVSSFKRYVIKGILPVAVLQIIIVAIPIVPGITSTLYDGLDLVIFVLSLLVLFSIKQAKQMQGYHDQWAKTYVIKK